MDLQKGIEDQLISTIGAYLDYHSVGDVTAKDLNQETLKIIKTLACEVEILLEQNINEWEPPRLGGLR